MSRVIHYVELY